MLTIVFFSVNFYNRGNSSNVSRTRKWLINDFSLWKNTRLRTWLGPNKLSNVAEKMASSLPIHARFSSSICLGVTLMSILMCSQRFEKSVKNVTSVSQVCFPPLWPPSSQQIVWTESKNCWQSCEFESSNSWLRTTTPLEKPISFLLTLETDLQKYG